MPRGSRDEFHAAERFHEKHERDPEARFETRMSLESYMIDNVLKYSADGYERAFRRHFNDLKDDLELRKQVEAELLRKYKYNGAVSAPGKKSE